jgi:hypothetical protein
MIILRIRLRTAGKVTACEKFMRTNNCHFRRKASVVCPHVLAKPRLLHNKPSKRQTARVSFFERLLRIFLT